MRPKPSAPDLLRDLLLAVVVFAVVFLVTNCAPKAFPPATPNPLDEPGASPDNASAIRARHLRVITGNPGY
jgi:hypothetical protein